MPEVLSTAITRIEYDALAFTLDVTFVTGNTYTYVDVLREVYARFVAASSKGEFFSEHIRDQYDFVGPRK